ncbi:CoA transferase, partial [Planctomycetota bacterium]
MSDSVYPKDTPTGLLDGLRVVEIVRGNSIAAPLVGMLLAEQGAEVVRAVGPPDPSVDPVLDALLARGKTETSVDWRQAEGLATVQRLLASADVVIENEGYAESARPAVEFDAIRKAKNPGLISCSLAPFPDYDPRSKLPGYEALAGAAGFLYSKPLGRPAYHDFPVGSVIAALYAANAVVAALIARLRLGRGQHIETSLYQSNLASQVLQILVRIGVPRGFLAMKMVGSPAMRCWECRDQRYVYLHITMPAHNLRMLEMLTENGFQDEVNELRAVMSPETMQDPSQYESIGEAKQVKEILSRVFLKRTAEEWEHILGVELCCIKVRTISEWLNDSMTAGMSDACKVEDPVFGELLGPGPLVTSPDIPVHVRPRTQDETVFAQLLERWESLGHPVSAVVDAAPPVDPGPPLEGVRVVDLSRIIAGPCAGRVLAELGAEVVSLQSPTRLDWALSFHLVFNAGKRSVTLDFKTEEGKKRLWAILAHLQPDVLIQNYRHLDIARAASVGPERVRERFPHVTYAHLNAYGNDGVWKDRPGFEQVVQAVSGIQLAYARGGRPRLLPSPVIDVGCGLLGAFGMLLGLYQRKRTGKGAFVTSHLTSISVLLQLPQIAAQQRDGCLSRARQRGASFEYDPDREVIAGILSSLGTTACLAGQRGDLRRWLEHAEFVRPGDDVTGRELEVAAKHFSRHSVFSWPRLMRKAGVQDTVAVVPYPNMRHLADEIRRYDPRPKPARASYPESEEPRA